MNRQRVLLLASAIFAVFVLTTCNTGLGTTVDTQHPNVKILTPVAESSNGGSQVLFSGTYTDDKGLKSVTFTLYKKKSTEPIEGFPKTVHPSSSDSNTIKPYSSGASNGTWNFTMDSTGLEDGSYRMVVVGNDGSYDSGAAECDFKIDNTKPIFLLSKPNSTDISDPSNFGTSITIAGEIGDDSTTIPYARVQIFPQNSDESTSPLEFTLFDNNGTLYTTDTLVYENLSISGGTDITLAKYNTTIASYEEEHSGAFYSASPEDQKLHDIYKTIYGDTDPSETVYFYAYIEIEDEAGNVSDGTWIKTDLSNEINAINPSYEKYTISGLKKALNGSLTGDEASVYLTAMEASKTGLSQSDSFATRKLYGMSINRDVAPYYEFKGLTVTNGGTWHLTNAVTLYVNCGTEGYKVKPNTLKVQIYAAKDNNSTDKASEIPVAVISASNIYSGTTPAANIEDAIENGSYQFTLPNTLATGNYLLEATGKDVNNQDLTGKAIYGFTVDSSVVLPSINKITVSAGSDDIALNDQTEMVPTVGGVEKRFVRFKVQASSNLDENEDGVSETIPKVYATIDSNETVYTLTLVEDSYDTTSGSYEYVTDVIDISDFETDEVTVLVNAVTSAMVSDTKTLRINNKGPSVEFTSPAKDSAATFFGQVILMGTAYSTYSSMSDIKYLVVDNTTYSLYEKVLNGSDSEKVEAYNTLVEKILKQSNQDCVNSMTANSWKFTFTPFGSAAVDSYSSIPYTSEGVYTLPVLFAAEDNLGNTSLITDFAINYDPYGDRPVTEIGTPGEDKIVSGTIRIAGTAVDNVKVNEVYLQIDVNNDGKYNSTDISYLENAADLNGDLLYTIVRENELDTGDHSADPNFWGIKASGTGIWSYKVNTSNELLLSTETNTYLRIRAAALDNNNTLGRWSDEVIVQIDPQAPSIDVNGVRDYDSEPNSATIDAYTNQNTYEDLMALQGDWYLSLNVYDESGIYREGMYYISASTSEGLDDQNAVHHPVEYYQEYSFGSKPGYTVLLPLETGSGEGTRYIRFVATDATEEHSGKSESEYVVKYDNSSPEHYGPGKDINGENAYLYDVSDSSDSYNPLSYKKLKLSNYVVSFRGYATDAGTGFSKALFYFRRQIDGVTTIELPLPSYDSTSGGYLSSVSAAVIYNADSSPVSKSKTDSYENKVGLDDVTGLYGVTLTDATRTSTTFVHPLVDDYSFIRAGGVAYINGGFHIIEKVNGTTITFADEVSAAGSSAKKAFFPMALVVDNKNTEVGNYDNGIYYVENDDGDGIAENVSIQGEMASWQASVLADELEDGPVFIDTIVIDNAENFSSVVSTNVMLANHTPRVSKVYLAVDIDKNESFSDGELGTRTENGITYNYYAAGNGVNLTDSYFTLDDTGVKMTGDMAVAIEMLGDQDFSGYGAGSGTLYYNAGITSSLLSAPNVSASMSEFSAVNKFASSGTYTPALANLYKIYFDENDVSGEDGNYYINISIADSTPGIVRGTADSTKVKNGITYYQTYGTQATAINIPIIVDLTDEIGPKTVIDDFYWKSSSDNSIYEKDSDNGHIELSEDLPSGDFAAGNSGVYDKDPKVSGKISLRGSVFDDQLIGSIWVNISEKTLSDYETGGSYGNSGTASDFGDSKTYYQMARFEVSSEGSEWICASAQMSSNGYAFSVNANDSDSYLNHSGHKVTWQLDLDTEKLDSKKTVKDMVITVAAVDHNNRLSSITNVNVDSSADDANKSRPYYQMDVVPYVTSLTTVLSEKNKKYPSVYGRTALGAWPVYYEKYSADGSTNVAETVKVNGFNLDNGTVTLAGTANNTAVLSDGEFTIPSGAKSGKVTLSVNSIPSLNNLNNNEASGSYSKVDTSVTGEYKILRNYYNRMPNNINNNLLTDDFELYIWDIDSIAARGYDVGDISALVMKVNPTNGMLGFAYSDSPGYRFFLPNGSDSSYLYWGWGWDRYVATEFAYDSLGNTYGTAAEVDISGTSKASRYRLHSSKWGVSHGGMTMGSSDTQSAYNNINSIRLETMATVKGGTFVGDPSRIQSPSIVLTNSDNLSTNVYLAYYDNSTSEIRLRVGKNVYSNGKNNFGQFNDTSSSVDNIDSYSKYPTISIVSSVANGAYGNENAKPGNKVSLGVLPGAGTNGTDILVIVWYDATNESVWFSYLTTPLDYSSREGDTYFIPNWSTPVEILEAGTAGGYCKLAVDGDNGIHIAAYSKENSGSLVYTYMSSYTNESASLSLVDSYGSAGQNLTIDFAKNASGKWIPYIGYYTESLANPKLAYMVDTSSANPDGADEEGMFTQKWEVVLIPVASKEREILEKELVCVGLYRNANGTLKDFPSTSKTFTKNGVDVSGRTYGNGTSNPVLGYGINYSKGNTTYIETAQMR